MIWKSSFMEIQVDAQGYAILISYPVPLMCHIF